MIALLLARVPRFGWALLAFGMACALHVRHDRAAVRTAYAAGAASVEHAAAEAVVTYTTTGAPLRAAVVAARIASDTMHRRTASHVAALTAAIAEVPVALLDSVRPVIVAATLLSEDVTRLMAMHVTERAAAETLHQLDSLTITRQAVVIASLTKERDRRPRWRTVAAVGSTALTAGVLVGRFLLHSRSP